MAAPAPARTAPARLPPLTPRETEVAELVAQGLTAHQVARQLWLSPRTVENHIARARAKIGAPNTPALVRWVTQQEAARPGPAQAVEEQVTVDGAAEVLTLDAALDAELAVPDPPPPAPPRPAVVVPGRVIRDARARSRPPSRCGRRRRFTPLALLLAPLAVFGLLCVGPRLVDRYPAASPGAAMGVTPTSAPVAALPGPPAPPPAPAVTSGDDAEYAHLRAVVRQVSADARGGGTHHCGSARPTC